MPVGPVSTSASIQLGPYLDFTVTGALTPTTLDYSFSYTNNGSTDIAVRSSADGFASNVACISTNGLSGGDNTLVFNLSSLGTLSPPNSGCTFTTHPPPVTHPVASFKDQVSSFAAKALKSHVRNYDDERRCRRHKLLSYRELHSSRGKQASHQHCSFGPEFEFCADDSWFELALSPRQLRR